MKNSWILPVAALAVGAAGGYISGKSGGGDSTATVLEESAQRSSSASSGRGATTSAEKKTRSSNIGEISKIPGSSNRIQALLEFYAGLSPDQLAAEAAKLENLPMNERLMASFLLFGRWAEVDAQAAMAFSNTMGFAGGFVRPTILQSWASVDPVNAAKYYQENPREFAMMGMMGGRGPMGGQGGASIIAAEWARLDPDAAMAWATGLTTERGQAMSSVINELAKTDPQKAAGLVAQMDPDEQGRAYRSVATQFGALDFSEAQSWVRTLPASEQAAALASAVEGLASKDAVEATKQFALMPEGEAKNRVVDDIVRNLARVDISAAGDFLRGQQDEGAIRNGMRELMPNWTAQDPAGALTYVNSYAAGPLRDEAAQAYIWSNNSSSPADLIRVAEGSITDENTRNRSIGVAAMRWMREDPEAARAYVESSSSLSAEAKERITSGRGMWGGGGGGGGPRGRGGRR